MISEPNIQMKPCSKCGEVKPLSAYCPKVGTRLGVQSSCKACGAAQSRRRYHSDPEYRRRKLEFNARYIQMGYGKLAHRRFRRRHPEEPRYQIPAETARQMRQRCREENPEQYKAHCAVSNALRAGTLKKQTCCVCGVRKVQGHHEDYANPLDVMWFCKPHHAAWHRLFVVPFSRNSSVGDK